jgi:predicted permease
MIDRLIQLWRRLLFYWRRDQFDREMEEEMRFHMEMKAEENLRDGMDEKEAKAAAKRQFGNYTLLQEVSREMWGFKSIETLIYDLRYGSRRLVKQPVFTLIAVASLALGIGANTAIFSLVNTMMLRPLPVDRPEQIVSLNNAAENRTFPTFSYPNYKDFRDRNDVFDGLLAYRFAPLGLSHDGINERLWGYIVTGNYFEALGVNAALGRVITTDDDQQPGASPVAVVSYKCWQDRFGGEQNIIGKNVIVNGRSYTIIGVAPKGFYGTEIISAPEIWFPMSMQSQIEVGSSWLDDRETEPIFIQGRLKPGVSFAQAQSAMTSIAAQLEQEYPIINEGKQVKLSSAGLYGDSMRGMVFSFAGLLMMVVGLVLLLACINLANLLLARAAERRREIAVRLALGASRLRLVRQLLTESVILSVGGGILGLVLAFWLVNMAVNFTPPVDIPLTINLYIDYRVLIFTCIVSIITGLVFGLLPALQATKTDLVPALKDEMAFGGHRRSWWKGGLIVLQIALSLVLLISGGLMMRGLQQAQNINLGFNTQNAIEVSFDLRLQGYNEDRGREFQKRLLEQVRALPGVASAATADFVPVDLHFSRAPVFIEGQEPQRATSAPLAMCNRISPEYFQAMGTKLLQGRDFTEQDNEKAQRVVIVNDTFARRFWPGEDPIGKRFSIGSADEEKVQVIGVSQDGKYTGLNEEPKPFVYSPVLQSYSGTTNIIVRSQIEPQKLIGAVRNEVLQLDPNLPISLARTLEERMDLPLLPARITASLLGSFGVLALVLAGIGIYGVMAYSVSRRTREIAIRAALGAQRTDILKLVMGQGIVLTLIGIVIGLVVAFALTGLMKSLLFGVSASDPLTFTLIVLLLSVVSMLACYIPARRALKIDPGVALKYE